MSRISHVRVILTETDDKTNRSEEHVFLDADVDPARDKLWYEMKRGVKHGLLGRFTPDGSAEYSLQLKVNGVKTP